MATWCFGVYIGDTAFRTALVLIRAIHVVWVAMSEFSSILEDCKEGYDTKMY